MFYDTGIGKEGYSIIGQGQIDKILSGKPEERRELFDEAAGIVKFKRRKNLSLKKLEEERMNLTRVNDILSELEKQLGPLEKQSETAKEYLKKKEELKTYDINMFLLEEERLRERIKELEEKYTTASSEMEESNERYDKMKAEYEAIEEEVEEIDLAIETAKNQLNETNLLKQQLEGQINVLKEQINTVRMNDEHYGNRANTIRVEIDTRQEQKNSLGAEKTEVQEKLDSALAQDRDAREGLIEIQSRIAEHTSQIEEKKQEIMDLLGNRASTQAKIQHYDTTKDQIAVRKAELARNILEVSEEGERLAERLREYEEELGKVQETIRGYTTQIEENEHQIERLQKELGEKQEKLRIGQTAYHRESSRLESLKNITERYDGYGNSIRKVMANKDREKGLIGVVADIIKVDKEYEIAVETALGGSIQNIVTDNEDTAKTDDRIPEEKQIRQGNIPTAYEHAWKRRHPHAGGAERIRSDRTCEHAGPCGEALYRSGRPAPGPDDRGAHHRRRDRYCEKIPAVTASGHPRRRTDQSGRLHDRRRFQEFQQPLKPQAGD